MTLYLIKSVIALMIISMLVHHNQLVACCDVVVSRDMLVAAAGDTVDPDSVVAAAVDSAVDPDTLVVAVDSVGLVDNVDLDLADNIVARCNYPADC